MSSDVVIAALAAASLGSDQQAPAHLGHAFLIADAAEFVRVRADLLVDLAHELTIEAEA